MTAAAAADDDDVVAMVMMMQVSRGLSGRRSVELVHSTRLLQRTSTITVLSVRRVA